MSTLIMRDRDIRTNLRNQLKSHHDLGDTLLIDELGLCQGNARVDIAVVNGTLSGYEIKSEADTLYRLPHQAAVYSQILDYITIVASRLHIEKIATLIPEWWGITEVVPENEQLKFDVVRPAHSNPSVDPFSLAQLLWRDEVVTILMDLGFTKGLSGKPRHLLWKKLVQEQTLDDLKMRVRETLKLREGWRVDPPQTLNGDLFQFDAKSLRSPDSRPEQHKH
jgi:hypothetical protein